MSFCMIHNLDVPHNQRNQFAPFGRRTGLMAGRCCGRYGAEAEWLLLDGSKADIQVFTLHWIVMDKLDHRP